MDKYRYELKYINDGYESQVSFNAGIDINELADNLKYFLKSCSWTDKQVEELINGGNY